MRRLRNVLVVATSYLAILSLSVLSPVTSTAVSAQRSEHSAASDRAYVEGMLYATRLSDFVAVAKSPPDSWFDWSTDGCSAPLVGNTGRSFNFTNACRRHDFGYRNLKLLERRYGTGSTYWNGAGRERVDRQFRADMVSHCNGRPVIDRPTCWAWAETFYRAVRIAGGP
jgi:hypothetical protein